MDLAKVAMLASVSIVNGGLLGERRDKVAGGYVERKFSLQPNRSKTSKFLIDRKHAKVKAVIAAAQRVREVYYKHTLPWGDDKTRLLAVALHETFCKKMQDAELELRAAWDEYLHVYPALIADSERELGQLFDRAQYPSVDRARDMFAYKLTYWPIPSTGHFVAQIADEAVRQATSAMSLEIETRLKDAARDLVERGRETVATFVDRLESFKSPADGKIIRDSLMRNCREVGSLIEDMNITYNKEIQTMANQMMRLGSWDADFLRAKPEGREAAISEGKRILAKMIELDSVDLQVSEMVAEAAEYDF